MYSLYDGTVFVKSFDHFKKAIKYIKNNFNILPLFFNLRKKGIFLTRDTIVEDFDNLTKTQVKLLKTYFSTHVAINFRVKTDSLHYRRKVILKLIKRFLSYSPKTQSKFLEYKERRWGFNTKLFLSKVKEFENKRRVQNL